MVQLLPKIRSLDPFAPTFQRAIPCRVAQTKLQWSIQHHAPSSPTPPHNHIQAFIRSTSLPLPTPSISRMTPTPAPPLLIPIRTCPPHHRHRPHHLPHLLPAPPIPPARTPVTGMRMRMMMVMMPATSPRMRSSRLPRPAPRRRPLSAYTIVPRAAARVRRRVGWRPEIAARAEDPEEQQEADDGADDDAGDGAAREGLGVGGLVVV